MRKTERGEWDKTVDRYTRQAEDRGQDERRTHTYRHIHCWRIHNCCVYHRFQNSFFSLFRLFQTPQTGVIMSISRTGSVKQLLKTLSCSQSSAENTIRAESGSETKPRLTVHLCVSTEERQNIGLVLKS